MRYIRLCVLLLACPCGPVLSQSPYLGQPLPGSNPVLFAPGIVSTSLSERDLAISPDGIEIYFTLQSGAQSSIVYVKFENGKWSRVRKAIFSTGPSDLEPAFSPDGNTLYFVSNRTTENGFDIWYVQRSGSSWSAAVNVGPPVNTTGNEYYPSVTSDGTIYYTANYSGIVNNEDIWFSTKTGGTYASPQALPSAINTSGDEFNAFVGQDGSYIYFSNFNQGLGDLLFSEKKNGSWTAASLMEYNSDKLDYCPYVTPDGNYFFFTSEKAVTKVQVTQPFDVTNVIKSYLFPRTTGGNIYWVERP